MVRLEDKIYKWCETGEWLLCGKVFESIDGEFIKWYD